MISSNWPGLGSWERPQIWRSHVHTAPSVGDCAGVILEDPAATNPVVTAGWPTCSAPTTPALNNNEVRVTVCVDLEKQPLANALGVVCISGADKGFRASSVAQKEVPP